MQLAMEIYSKDRPKDQHAGKTALEKKSKNTLHPSFFYSYIHK